MQVWGASKGAMRTCWRRGGFPSMGGHKSWTRGLCNTMQLDMWEPHVQVSAPLGYCWESCLSLTCNFLMLRRHSHRFSPRTHSGPRQHPRGMVSQLRFHLDSPYRRGRNDYIIRSDCRHLTTAVRHRRQLDQGIRFHHECAPSCRPRFDAWRCSICAFLSVEVTEIPWDPGQLTELSPPSQISTCCPVFCPVILSAPHSNSCFEFRVACIISLRWFSSSACPSRPVLPSLSTFHALLLNAEPILTGIARGLKLVRGRRCCEWTPGS